MTPPEYYFETYVTGIDPVNDQVLVRCPWCGAHHRHGVNWDLDVEDGEYAAYRVRHCRGDDWGYPTVYRIIDPCGLVAWMREAEMPVSTSD